MEYSQAAGRLVPGCFRFSPLAFGIGPDASRRLPPLSPEVGGMDSPRRGDPVLSAAGRLGRSGLPLRPSLDRRGRTPGGRTEREEGFSNSFPGNRPRSSPRIRGGSRGMDRRKRVSSGVVGFVGRGFPPPSRAAPPLVPGPFASGGRRVPGTSPASGGVVPASSRMDLIEMPSGTCYPS